VNPVSTTEIMSHSQRNAGFIFFGAMVVRLAFHLGTGFLADDAFITFRFAENIAAGLGFVYNAGQPVLGTSTPLFTLILSLFAVLGIGTIHGAILVSLTASGITAALLYRFAERLRFGRLAALPALAYMFWPRSIVAETCGMETAFYTLLVTAAFYYCFTRQRYYALAAATLATVTRPEALILLGLIVVHSLVRNRRDWVRIIGIPAVVLLPWAAFATWYFGSPLPHSIIAKLALYSQVGAESPFLHFVTFLGLNQPYGWLLLPAAIGGAYWLYRKQDFGRLEIPWLVLVTAFFTFSRTHLFFWYAAPIYPIYLLIAAAVLPPIVDRFPQLKARQAVLIPVVSLGLVAALSFGTVLTGIDHYHAQQQFDRVHHEIGRYLRTHTEETAIVAAEDIGYIGYYSQRRILDRDGLVSPEVVPYNRSGAYGELIENYRPDWVVLSTASPISKFVDDPGFRGLYRFEKRFVVSENNQYKLFRLVAAGGD